MTNLEAAMHIIQEYGKYEKEFGFSLDMLEATALAVFALAD